MSGPWELAPAGFCMRILFLEHMPACSGYSVDMPINRFFLFLFLFYVFILFYIDVLYLVILLLYTILLFYNKEFIKLINKYKLFCH